MSAALDDLGDTDDLDDLAALDAFINRLVASLDPAARLNFREPERWALKRAMERCGLTEYPPVVAGEEDGRRTAGDMICEVCGHEYIEHPLDWRVIGYGDWPFLNVICDGRRVKL